MISFTLSAKGEISLFVLICFEIVSVEKGHLLHETEIQTSASICTYKKLIKLTV